METLLRQLMVHAVRCYHRRAGARLHFQPATLADAQDFILEESFLYDYPTLTLEQLADRLGLSVRQTQRLLQERHGQTFLQKRSSARISASEILLAYTDKSIEEIALEVGYSSSEHFSGAFRAFHGMSPRQYRKTSRQSGG